MNAPYSPVDAIVTAWLHGEHEYQFDKNKVTHNADPQSSIRYIMGTEIQNKWDRFRLFKSYLRTDNDPTLALQAGQNILKACGAARAAMVWESVYQGAEIEAASDESFKQLENHFKSLGSTAVSTELLLQPIETALAPSDLSVRPNNLPGVFTRLAELSLVHLTEEETRSGGLIVPVPGVTSGQLDVWDI